MAARSSQAVWPSFSRPLRPVGQEIVYKFPLLCLVCVAAARLFITPFLPFACHHANIVFAGWNAEQKPKRVMAVDASEGQRQVFQEAVSLEIELGKGLRVEKSATVAATPYANPMSMGLKMYLKSPHLGSLFSQNAVN